MAGKATKDIEEKLGTVKALLSQGLTVRRIARVLGINHASLYRLLDRHKIKYIKNFWRPTIELPDDSAILAYIAGIIDGEGSVFYQTASKKFIVKVTMTDETVIRWLAKFGGKFNVYPRKGKLKTAYSWIISRNKDVIYLLIKILPYLIVKKEIAEFAIIYEKGREKEKIKNNNLKI